MALNFRPGQLAPFIPGIISGYGGGTFNPGRGGLEQVPPQEPMPPQAPDSGAPRKGLFSKDGTGWKILGVIGDALQTAGGGQGTYTPALMNIQEQVAKEKQLQQRLQAEAEQRRMEREAANAEWDRRFNMQRDNPAPTNAQREYEWAKTQPGMENIGYQQWVQDYYRPQMQFVSDAMGGGQMVSKYPNAQHGGLQPGHTEDGYTFMGGDPGDPSNWKQGGGVGGDTGMFP